MELSWLKKFNVIELQQRIKIQIPEGMNNNWELKHIGYLLPEAGRKTLACKKLGINHSW